MTREKAMIALKEGHKITHHLFAPHEYVELVDGTLRDEEGYKMYGFFECRTDPNWDKNWNIWNGKKLTDNQFCDFWNTYSGENGIMSGIDIPEQLTLNGRNIKEFMEYVLTIYGCEDFKNKTDEMV